MRHKEISPADAGKINSLIRMKDFVVELEALTKKYGVRIGGCGCCDSPWLSANGVTARGEYGFDGAWFGCQLMWYEPEEEE